MSSQRASQSSSRKRKAEDSFSQPSTSRGHLSSRKRRIIEDDDDDEPSTSQRCRVSKQPRLANISNNGESEGHDKLAGKIEKIQMINFMCHSNIEINFNERINFITGRNGSGKSAIMAALTVVLGGSARITGRGSGIADFIKKGENSGRVSITLINEGLKSYKPETYGNRITITRQFTKSTNGYSVKSAFGYIISRKKEEVERITMQFNLQIDNPICILNQDIARTFLGATEPTVRFNMFMKATQLEDLKNKYASIFELLFGTRNILLEKEKTLEEASKEVKELKHKLELFLALQRDVEQKKLLENELLWSMVCVEEKNIAGLKKRKEDIQQRKENIENSETNFNAIIKALEAQLKEHDDKINEYTNIKNEKRNIKGEYHRECQKLQKEVDSVEGEIRRVRNKISHLLTDINGIKDHMAQSDDNASQSQVEKDQAAEKIKEKKIELNEITDRMNSAQRDVANAQETLEQHNADLDKFRGELRELERKKQHIEVLLNNARISQSTQKSANLAKFGHYMPKLVEAINEADKRRQFHVKPIGPCGFSINLKSESRKWAKAIESVIGGLMPTFCCDNQNDFNALSRIIERVCANQRQPNIVISKFRSRHNITSRTVTQFPAIVNQLDVSNDVVFNTVVDQAAVECIGLFDSDEQAGRFLAHVQNVPQNLHMGVTAQASHYYPAPNYRSYVNDRPLQYFDEPVKSKDAIKGIENELQEVEGEIGEKNSQITDIKLRSHRLREFLQSKETLLRELRQKKRILETEINELKDIEESRPTIQTRVALEEELQIHERNHAISTAKLEELTEKQRTLKTQAESWNEKLKSVSEEENIINGELSSVQDKLEELRFSVNKEKKQKQTAESKLEDIKKELERIDKEIKQKEERLDEKMKDATETCPDRVDTNRSPADIQKALQKCNKKIEQSEKLNGSKEEAIEEYKTKKEAFKKIRTSVVKMDKSLENLIRKVTEKQERFDLIQDMTANMISFYFQCTLNARGYEGSLNFDFEEKTLDLAVKPRDEKEIRKDTKTLSGGERSYSMVSFILAVWKSIHMPFYFLDEFDVFMDKLNRKVILTLLLDHCKNTSAMQFVFITPQDTSSVQASDIVTIYKMPDPERKGL